MAYSELIKNFSRIREYMREFYVYGFKSREEYTQKSARSYDDERRRLESWFGDHMQFRRMPDGKNVFLSIDSRVSAGNPLYKAWKAKSFTDGDITLHFLLFDILSDPGTEMTVSELTERIDGYLCGFAEPKAFDESTVRKKLKEYVAEGIVIAEKRGKSVYYRRTGSGELPDPGLIAFFSEVAPCGVIGSFLLDKITGEKGHFRFKHHYITSAMDSEILCTVFQAMREKRYLTVKTANRWKTKHAENKGVPLKVMVSVRNGRQHLMMYLPWCNRVAGFRLDRIVSAEPGEECGNFAGDRERLERMLPHMWGVSTQSRSGRRLEHVEFTVRYTDDEMHIPQRLEREKRIGKVEHLDAHTSRFSAEVFDAEELVPWIRTFICRLVRVEFSNKRLEKQFLDDMEAMYALYGIEDGENDAVQ